MLVIYLFILKTDTEKQIVILFSFYSTKTGKLSIFWLFLKPEVRYQAI